MSRSWQEARDNIVNLPNDNSDTFELWLSYIYTNQIATKNGDDPEEFVEYERSDRIECEYKDPSQLYILTEKRQDISAQNSIIHAIFALM